MKIATFNAASIRARLPILVEWLAQVEPDVLAIQETKVEDDKFPLSDFEDLGYQVAIHGQKSWNGVAILSRSPISSVRTGFGDDLFPTDCRILSCEIDGVSIVNTYVPNGNTVGSDKFLYKLSWMERFRQLLDERYRPDEPVIWLGDINVAPKPIDVYDSKKMFGGVGHHPDEFARLDAIVDFGLIDVFRKHQPEGGNYTFWDFQIPRSVERNLGWRIDHIYATEALADRCQSCVIDIDPRRWTRPSDHTFVVADFDI
ncbi:MAG: exodeoxyribonuclease III [Fimbriimonas sp.]|nr:exodeoxyribonuclease III [Fimbriimonas sp.]